MSTLALSPAKDVAPEPLLVHALRYAAAGIPVLPLAPRDKRPVIADWHDGASTDPDQLDHWFGEGSANNIGLLTGPRSGLLVVDIDPRNGGLEGFAAFESANGKLPPTLCVETGGGGTHRIFRLPGDIGETGDRTNVEGFRGVDLKCGGQIVASPSIHPSGRPYVCEGGWDASRIAEAPDWLVNLVEKANRPTTGRIAVTGEIEEGSRNETLFLLACRMQGHGYAVADILGAVAAHNEAHCKPPLENAEVEAIVQGVQRYVQGDEHQPTDLGNAGRLRDLAAGDFRYEPAMRTWFGWDGIRWKPDNDGAIERLARKVCALLMARAATIDDADRRKDFLRFARQSQHVARIKAMVELAKTEPGVAITCAAFDRQPSLLNARNGTIDLRTGELRPHCRQDMITHMVEVDYDVSASCPKFESFLEAIFSGDAKLVDYVQTVAGYAATGETREQCFFLLHGEGANGKSTLLNTLRDALGGYVRHTATETLLVKPAGGASSDLARLMGVRLVTASEANPDQRLAEALLKQVTGDEPIVAREIYQKFVEWKPTFKILMGTNHLPMLTGDDGAIWRRVRAIPFNRTFAADEQDRHLSEKLQAERQGILRWIVDGAVRWYQTGLVTPMSVEAANENYRSTMDTVGQFLDDACEASAKDSVGATALYGTYRQFAQQRGQAPVSLTSFGRTLTRRGYVAERHGSIMHRRGLKLLPHAL